MTSDGEVLQRISALVQEEHDLRDGAADGTADHEAARARLADLEVALDQCWDLLRQRQARRAAGQDPDQAAVRSANEVEGYLG